MKFEIGQLVYSLHFNEETPYLRVCIVVGVCIKTNIGFNLPSTSDVNCISVFLSKNTNIILYSLFPVSTTDGKCTYRNGIKVKEIGHYLDCAQKEFNHPATKIFYRPFDAEEYLGGLVKNLKIKYA